jgi:hypothetical protein
LTSGYISVDETVPKNVLMFFVRKFMQLIDKWSKNRLFERKLENALDHLLNSQKEIKNVLKYAQQVELGSEIEAVFNNIKLAETQLNSILEQVKDFPD